ncbi:MAG TPA: hypothetical protein VGO30_00225 [Mycobacterium sp.]|nr:hypothetical protein [Mycobacterium sp.]
MESLVTADALLFARPAGIALADTPGGSGSTHPASSRSGEGW